MQSAAIELYNKIKRCGGLKEFLFIALLVLLMLRNFIKNKDTWKAFKKLNKTQLLLAVMYFLFTVFAAAVLIYYGGNWLAGQFSNIFVQAAVFALVVFVVFYFLGNLSNKMMRKITDGLLPRE